MCHNTFCLEILIEFFTFFVYKYCPFLPFEENDSRTNKTRVLLCKRLSRQCRDVWWYTFTCTGDGGLYCAVLGGFNCHLSVYSVIFGMVTNKRTIKQPGDPSARLLLTSVRRQSFAKMPKIDTLVALGDQMTSILNIL